MASKLRKAIGAVKDQTSISLTKVSSNSTSNLRIAILKATSHEDDPIDDRYVYEIVQFVSSSKLYASYCARAIGKRIGRTRNWIVALKSLLLILRIFQDGDPYFPREVLHAMKRGARILNLSSFRDDSNSTPYEFTVFVRTFAHYLDERLDCFLTGKLQRRYTTYRDKAESSPSSHIRNNPRPYEPGRNTKPAMLLDKISYWQRLMDRAISTKPTGQAMANRLIQTCLHAIVQETFDLYKDISDALTLLLDSFFHLQYQICVSAYHTCVKASKQYEDLGAFYASCKEMGVGRSSEYPSVHCISEELMETLQEFLKDQSSFPTIAAKSPNNRPLLLLPAPSSPSFSRSNRHDNNGRRSDFSDKTRYYECNSDFGSRCTSLEDLISATENGTAPSNSIDLEDYSDQFEKQHPRDSPFRISESGSTRSLPLLNSSMVDLLSLDEWPDNDYKETQQERKMESSQQEEEPPSSANSIHNNGDFMTFFDITTPSVQTGDTIRSNSFNGIPKEEISSGQTSHTNNFTDINEATTTAPMQCSNIPRTNSFSASHDGAIPSTHPSQFNAFSDAASPTIQASNANNFNAFPNVTATSSTLSTFPEATPSGSFSFRDSSEATTSSAHPASTPWDNMFHAFPETATHSIHRIPFNSYQELPTPTTHYITDSPHSNTFYQSRTQSMPNFSDMEKNYNGFHGHDLAQNFSSQDRTEQNNEHGDVPVTGWELAIVETTSQSGQSTNNMNDNFNPSIFDSLYNQHTPFSNHVHNQSLQPPNHVYNHSSSTPNHYNPFLEEPTEHNSFEQFAPTFQATQAPTFSSQHHTFESSQFPIYSSHQNTFQEISMPTFSTQQQQPSMAGNDPFAVRRSSSFSDRMSYESMGQPNLLQQQQSWLQNQNKIIEKHMAGQC
ncbi:hypothetical protein Leryth_022954 [Lithospermum erythrorhizon]|nr:hypothetical protein Leryth_022954 [Lithospermum erythrorhizon]